MTTKNTLKNLLILSLSLLVMLSCNLPGQTGADATPTINVMTAAARTVAAMTGGTQQPQENTQQAENSATSTQQPDDTATSTNVPPAATQTNQPAPCDRAQFVGDVSVPDGTEFDPGEDFTKTWRIMNNGSCTWTTSYDVIFFNGEKMAAPDSVPLTKSVAPGQTIDISVNMEAPDAPGEHRGDWKLRNGSNQIFGIKSDASGAFFVIINTVAQAGATEIYNFARKSCDAVWKNDADELDCPGEEGETAGFIVRNDNPKLSDGVAYSGVALETHPEWVDNGIIMSQFPAIEVKDGYRFKARVGCLYGGTACNFRYQVTYKTGAGPWTLVTQGVLKYAEGPRSIDADLSFLKGENVQFGLVAGANGSSEQDWVIWVNPRIVK